MLEQIVESNTEGAILSFFLSAPYRSFSVLEISKRLKMSHPKAAHALSKLVGDGVLANFIKKGKKYYLINHRYKLLPGMQAFWNKEGPKYSDELFGAIKKLGEVKAAFLSGLFTAQPNLPVDILLVGKINLQKLSDFLKSVEKLMGQEINYSVMTVDEFELRRDTFDKFIKDIFDYRHLVVVDELS